MNRCEFLELNGKVDVLTDMVAKLMRENVALKGQVQGLKAENEKTLDTLKYVVEAGVYTGLALNELADDSESLKKLQSEVDVLIKKRGQGGSVQAQIDELNKKHEFVIKNLSQMTNGYVKLADAVKKNQIDIVKVSEFNFYKESQMKALVHMLCLKNVFSIDEFNRAYREKVSRVSWLQ